MEDDKLKDLFVNFKPELSSDFSFLTKLKNNLEQVELIKQHNEEIAARRKKAVAIAACTGFVVGFLFSLALPYLGNAMENIQVSLPTGTFLKMIMDNYLIAAWLIIGAATVLISLNVYDISMSLMQRQSQR